MQFPCICHVRHDPSDPLFVQHTTIYVTSSIYGGIQTVVILSDTKRRTDGKYNVLCEVCSYQGSHKKTLHETTS